MFAKMLERLKNDFHVPIALLIFSITTTMHLWTKRDLGPQYVNSLYAMYAFLGGHAFVNRDRGDDGPTDAKS